MKTAEQLQQDYDSLKRLHDVTNQNLLDIVRQCEDLKILLHQERMTNKQLVLSKESTAVIIQNQLNIMNEKNNEYLTRIDFLTKKLREYGYLDKLGD